VSGDNRPAVSVIIPAYNCSATLGDTLETALGQTVRDLEVVVVDDGSSDGSHAIAEAYANRDSRVRVFRTENRGTAAARNTAIEYATGEFIAPLDGDDLWHPLKLDMQLRAFASHSRQVGLVYNWFREINAAGKVIGGTATPVVEGWVLHRHLMWNFISNGSTPLIRADILKTVGYGDDLRRAGCFCEDYYVQLEVARLCQFACVPAFLTGYRRTGGSMTSHAALMAKSHIVMFERLAAATAADSPFRRLCLERIAAHWVDYVRNRARRALWLEAADGLKHALRADAAAAVRQLLAQAGETLIYLSRRATRTYLEKHELPGTRPFYSVDPHERLGDWEPDLSPRRLRDLEALDAQWGGDRPMGIPDPVAGHGDPSTRPTGKIFG
jgi:glycosyltransferase involved in cell wall biosynthesis